MTSFRLRLLSPIKSEDIDNVVSFTGKDPSGSFGILANALRRITALSFGMATLRKVDGTIEYLALPGGLLYFKANELKITTSHFLRSQDLGEISTALEKTFRVEEEGVREIKRSLHQLDEAILRRLSLMSRRPGIL